jgi:hypothetical protein
MAMSRQKAEAEVKIIEDENEVEFKVVIGGLIKKIRIPTETLVQIAAIVEEKKN